MGRSSVEAAETFVVLKRDRATIDVIEVAEQQSWVHVQRILPDEKRLYEEIYRIPGHDTVVRIIDDHFVTVVFAACAGPSRQRVAQVIHESVPSLDEREVWLWASSDDAAQRTHGIRALGAICPNAADARWVTAFTEAAHHESTSVRKAVLDAVARAAWPQLWPLVDALAARLIDVNAEPTLHADALLLREAYRHRFPALISNQHASNRHEVR